MFTNMHVFFSECILPIAGGIVTVTIHPQLDEAPKPLQHSLPVLAYQILLIAHRHADTNFQAQLYPLSVWQLLNKL